MYGLAQLWDSALFLNREFLPGHGQGINLEFSEEVYILSEPQNDAINGEGWETLYLNLL